MTRPIFIILPVHNRAHLTAGFVASLLIQSEQNFHVLLVDDGCTDETVQLVCSRLEAVTVIRGDGKLWWAASVQRGIDWLLAQGASGDTMILIANDDTSFDDGFLQKARAWLDANPETMLQAVPVDPVSGEALDHGVAIHWPRLGMSSAGPGREIDALATRGLFCRLADIRVAGGFRSWLLPHYFSDYEFTIRAKRHGIRLATSEDVRVLVSRETTGIRSMQAMTLAGFMSVIFSKRCTLNPIYYSTFVLLSAPLRHQPLGLARIWAGFVVGLMKSIRLSLIGMCRGLRG